MKGQRIFDKSGGRCWYCGILLTQETFTIDHFLPRKWGGGNHADNKVPCCQSCNSKKRDRDLEHFRRIMGRKDTWIPFSEKQKEWLYDQYGIDIDIDHVFYYPFWFETTGLE